MSKLFICELLCKRLKHFFIADGLHLKRRVDHVHGDEATFYAILQIFMMRCHMKGVRWENAMSDNILVWGNDSAKCIRWWWPCSILDPPRFLLKILFTRSCEQSHWSNNNIWRACMSCTYICSMAGKNKSSQRKSLPSRYNFNPCSVAFQGCVHQVKILQQCICEGGHVCSLWVLPSSRFENTLVFRQHPSSAWADTMMDFTLSASSLSNDFQTPRQCFANSLCQLCQAESKSGRLLCSLCTFFPHLHPQGHSVVQ